MYRFIQHMLLIIQHCYFSNIKFTLMEKTSKYTLVHATCIPEKKLEMDIPAFKAFSWAQQTEYAVPKHQFLFLGTKSAALIVHRVQRQKPNECQSENLTKLDNEFNHYHELVSILVNILSGCPEQEF